MGTVRKALAICMAVFLLTAALGGCGAQDGGAGSQSSQAAAEQTALAETAKEQTAPAETAESQLYAPETAEGQNAPAKPAEIQPASLAAPDETSPSRQPGETPAAQTEPQSEGAEAALLPGEMPLEFVFSSGAGGWATLMTLNADGSFTGTYFDSDMGEAGEGYPNGTVYISEFTGQFGAVQRSDAYTYSMILETLDLSHEAGEEWIQEDFRYVASYPNGLQQGQKFLFCIPETSVDSLPEDFLIWKPIAYDQASEGTAESLLGCYGIYNQDDMVGFFAYADAMQAD